MIIVGIILLVLGLLISSSILFWLGVILLIAGLVLNFAPLGGPGPRRRYW